MLVVLVNVARVDGVRWNGRRSRGVRRMNAITLTREFLDLEILKDFAFCANQRMESGIGVVRSVGHYCFSLAPEKKSVREKTSSAALY